MALTSNSHISLASLNCLKSISNRAQRHMLCFIGFLARVSHKELREDNKDFDGLGCKTNSPIKNTALCGHLL